MNWLIGPLVSEANNRSKSLWELGISVNSLLELIGYVVMYEISNLTAKAVLTEMLDTKK